MAYVKVINDQIDQYPYTIGNLRRDNPHTSFPKSVTDDILTSYGVYTVVYAEQPEIDPRTQKAEVAQQPSLIDGVWTVGWTVSSKTDAEIQEHDDNEAAAVRSQRNMLLSGSDWTQVADAPVDTQAWATYRQALRDVTAQVGFPYDITWPVKPE